MSAHVIVALAALTFLTLPASVSAGATHQNGIDLARYSFAVTLRNGEPGIVRLALTDESVLITELQRFDPPFFSFENPRTVRHRAHHVGQAVFFELFEDLVLLANAQIETQTAEIICFGISPHLAPVGDLLTRRDFSRGMNEFRGELELVLGSNWCWEPTRVSPAMEIPRARAKELRAKLRTLAAQALRERISEFVPRLISDALP